MVYAQISDRPNIFKGLPGSRSGVVLFQVHVIPRFRKFIPMFIGKAVRVPGVTAMTIKKDLSLRKALKLTLRVLCVGNLFDLYEFF